jgi:transposase
MEAIIERVAGLDVHQATVVACVIVGSANTRPRKVVRTFRTFTADLLALSDWLLSEGVTHVGMEGTGVYWKPVYTVLEGNFHLIVGNAQHIKNVPGRKTDVKDSEWLADLVRHGLIAASFVPPKPIRELRDLVRYRRKLVEARSAERNRLLKLLESAGIKLSSVATNAFGVSGMAMLRALIDGQLSPAEMARLAKGKLRAKIESLQLALQGQVAEHHRAVLRLQLQRLEHTDADLQQLDALIEERLVPYADAVSALRTLPGVERVVAATIVAELGTDMTVFHSPQHLASWAGLCPGNFESAGKRSSSRTLAGNIGLKTALVEAANAAVKKRDTYLKDKFGKLRARRGHKRAIIAIAHKLLIAAFHILSTGQPYQDLGGTYLDLRNAKRTRNHLIRRLEHLGYTVELRPTAA